LIGVEMIYLNMNNVLNEHYICKSRGRVSFEYILWPFREWENERKHVVTILNTVEKKGSKQECVNLEAFIFDSTLYQSLKSIEVVFFLWMEIWAVWGCRHL
jgi:hypothetical protein